MSKDVLISIVNGSDKGYIYDCVKSIQDKSSGFSYDILVVDNCTGDSRLDELEKMGARLIRNNHLMGFAANHSQALPYLEGYRYLLIFNDDAFLVNNAFKVMIEALDSEEKTAIAGCHIADPDGALQPSVARFPDLEYFVRNVLGRDKKKGEKYPYLFTDDIDYSKDKYVDWVSGCCMGIKSDFIQRFGFLDTGYYMFVEDADLCWRAHDNGCQVKYLSQAKIIHYGGGSSKDNKRLLKPWLFLETQRSRLRFLRKHSLFSYFEFLIFIYTVLVGKRIKSVVVQDEGWSKDVIARLVGRPLY